MKLSEFKKLIQEEVSKVINKAKVNEAYEYTIPGDTISGTGGKWPDVNVKVGNDGLVTLSQKINGRTSKVMLSKKQFAQLIKEA
jgi:hypothetical protein